ncbi:hypothetical protein GCM10023185_07550 [Hymenobacter saemangeumensis]|uniref:DoxX family protein n=1 Tax=Hymenobacter saemangeumensis TaxID=1084522 RepID=A0ABP8I2R7_9BACT
MNKLLPPPSPAAAALNAVAASALIGALLGPVLYPLGASAGLWQELARTASSSGDAPADFVMAGLGALVGGVAGAVVAAAQLRLGRGRAFGAVAVDLLRFYLAFIVLGYGLVKVYAAQFPQLWANLDTPPADLSPMRVAWQFFGYSRPYQQFLGWAEVVASLLLLPRRTATLGALLMLVVMGNVFAINLFFDVSVKLMSGLYLAAALLILLQDTGRLWYFFIGNQPVPSRRVATDWFETRRGRRLYRGLTLGVLGLMLLAFMGDFQGIREQAGSQQPTPITGVWQPMRAERWRNGSWQRLPPTDSLYPRRLYFQAGQAVLRNEFYRDRFMCYVDSAASTADMLPRNERNEFLPARTWQYRRPGRGDSLHIAGSWRGDSLRLALVPARLGTLRSGSPRTGAQ